MLALMFKRSIRLQTPRRASANRRYRHHRGFPPALMELKRGIDIVCPGLKPENPGSRWPKTSLAALTDRARLTPEQLQRLNAICVCAHVSNRL